MMTPLLIRLSGYDFEIISLEDRLLLRKRFTAFRNG